MSEKLSSGKEVFKNEYVSVVYYADSDVMKNIWKAATEDMEESDYKKTVEDMAAVVASYNPVKMIADTRDYAFVVTPDLQEWSGEAYFRKCVEAGLAQIAFIVPEDIFTQVSIEQMMSEDIASQLTTSFFSNIKEAEEWIV
ncbi:MAG: hypothetical protein JJT94_15510 [Bernardetiaceae bacterium]|nr:hypothetical protein [Bernardetiaceae bacterium]